MRLVALAAIVALAGCVAQEASPGGGAPFTYGGQVAAKQGTETHSWENAGSTARVSWGGQASAGTLTVTILDAEGREVHRGSVGAGQQGMSGLTAKGVPGQWTVRLDFVAFTGQMGLVVSRA